MHKSHASSPVGLATFRVSQSAYTDTLQEQSSSSSSPESYRSNESGVGQYQLAGRLNQFEMQECKATEHLPLFTCLQLHNSVDMPQFDDLGRTINSNFSKAAEANARVLGINMAAIRDMTLMKSLWTGREDIPVSLKPANIQYRVVHDPVIDTIPHPQLRQNILRSLAMAQLDEASISRSLRTSGALVEVQGEKKRCGLVVWGRPEDMENWELTEAFMFQFGHLLNGCEDLIAATNRWRSQRGEPPLSSHQAIWNDMIRDIA